MFEKFAEMNNKYDVKNFSDLIDNFKVEDEMKLINDFIRDEMLNGFGGTPTGPVCLFDPIIVDKSNANYQFKKYEGTRYDLDEIS